MTELRTCSYGRLQPEMGFPIVASLQLPKWIPDAQAWPRCWLITPRWSYFRSADWSGQYVSQLERFGDAVTAADRRIDAEIAAIRRKEDAGKLTPKEAADARVEALDAHLTEVRRLRLEHLGGSWAPEEGHGCLRVNRASNSGAQTRKPRTAGGRD